MRRHRTTRAMLVALVMAASGPALEAQQPGGQGPAVEARLRQRMGQVIRQRLGLTDEQARRLADVSRRYEQERRALHEQERELRLAMRDEILAGDSAANQDRVARNLDRMLAAQRRRIEIVEREQKELSAFLTPVQRAKYLAFQDEARRRVDELRRERMQGAPRRPRPGAGPRP